MNNFVQQIIDKGYAGVLCDIDGTLLDSMSMWHDIDIRFMDQRKLDMPEDLQMQIAGMSMYETAVYMKANFHLTDTPEELMEIWNQMAEDEYRYEIEMKPGAEEFLNLLLESNVPVACATSNSRRLVNATLEHHRVFQKLDAIVTTDEIPHGKPAPDVYLEAARILGVDAKKCIVFEDILQGIQAGIAAGATVISIDDEMSRMQTEKQDLSYAVIQDYYDLANINLPEV